MLLKSVTKARLTLQFLIMLYDCSLSHLSDTSQYTWSISNINFTNKFFFVLKFPCIIRFSASIGSWLDTCRNNVTGQEIMWNLLKLSEFHRMKNFITMAINRNNQRPQILTWEIIGLFKVFQNLSQMTKSWTKTHSVSELYLKPNSKN